MLVFDAKGARQKEVRTLREKGRSWKEESEA